jgi:hypothetical protein
VIARGRPPLNGVGVTTTTLRVGSRTAYIRRLLGPIEGSLTSKAGSFGILMARSHGQLCLSLDIISQSEMQSIDNTQATLPSAGLLLDKQRSCIG